MASLHTGSGARLALAFRPAFDEWTFRDCGFGRYCGTIHQLRTRTGERFDFLESPASLNFPPSFYHQLLDAREFLGRRAAWIDGNTAQVFPNRIVERKGNTSFSPGTRISNHIAIAEFD